MAKQNQVAKAQPDKKQQSKTKPATVAEPANGAAGLSPWSGGLFDAAGQGPAARLGDPRLQTAQRQALAAQIGQVQGNRYLQRTITSLQQNHPQPKVQPRLAQPAYLARKAGDQPKTETPASPARAAGMSFSLSGIHYRVQEGATFQPGPRGPQVMAVCLQALLGPQYTPGLENEVFREYSNRINTEYYAWMTGVAKQVEPFPYKSVHMHASHAGILVKLLENQFKLTVKLSDQQRELLSLGTSVETAWDQLHKPHMAAQLGVTFPNWYDEFLFARQLAQHTDLLQQFNEAQQQFEAAPNQKTHKEFMTSLQQLGQMLLARAKVWEAIRTDKQIGTGPNHQVVEAIHNNSTFLTLFLNYTTTQPTLAERALTEHAARVELLRRFSNYARRTVDPTNKGDEALAKQPARANAPRLPAKLSSFPQVGPPLFDAALGTDHTFLMAIEYPDVFEAFGLWVYKWEYLLVPPQKPNEKPADLDKLEGQTPGWGQVYSARLAHAQQYAQADIERVTNELGPAGIAAAGLAEANNILRYAGTVVKTFIESVFQPKYEQKIVFPSEGLYLVRCRAVRASGKDAEVVREPSVAYTLVYARDPNWMAQTRVQMGVKALASTKERLAELEAQLAKNPDQPKLRQELQELKLALGPLGPVQAQQRQAIAARIDELKKQLQQAKATGTSQQELEQELKAAEKQLKNLDKTIENRSHHAGLHRPGVTPERLIASFVSDTGQTVNLDLEAVEVERGESQFKYYVADSTTPDSEDETGEGKTRAEAILNALRTILEGRGGYGRGRVSVHIDGQIYTRRIEASLGSLLGEAVENISALLAVAAVAAAPFTGGASLAILLPAGAIGAIPAAYRLVDRGLEGRLKWDLATLMDIVNVAGSLAGVTQVVATPLRLVRIGRAAMIFGVGADGLGVVLIPVGIVEQLEALEGLPPGERAARTMMIIGSALQNVGVMAGQALVRRALDMQAHPDFKPDGETGGEAPGAKPKGGEGEASSGAGGETPGAKTKGSEGEAGPAAGQGPASQGQQGRPASLDADLARIGPVSEATRTRLEQQPELRQALAEHPHVANLLKRGEPPSLPPQATPAQIRQLAALLTEMEAAGFPVRKSAYQKQLREYFHKSDNFNNLSPALAELEQAFQTNKLRHMTQQEVIRMAQQGENIPLKPPTRREVERATKAIQAGRATPQEVEIILRQIVVDYRTFRTAQLKRMMAHPGEDGTKEFSTDRLTAETLRLQCGMGRDLTAESLQSLTLNSPAPVRIERYQINDFLPKQQHGFSIVTLPGGRRYIVDPTFAQFMDAKQPSYTGDPLLGGGATLETAQFTRDLLRDGFVPLTTREQAYHYARGLGATESQANHIADSLMANKGAMLTEIIANGQVSRFTTTPQDKVDDMDLRDLVPPEEGDVTLSDEVAEAKSQADLDPGMRENLNYLQQRLDDLAKVRQDVPIITTEKDK